MVQIRESCRAAGPRAPRSFPLLWFAMAVAVALVASLAIAAANSGGLDRLLPKDELYASYFTT